MGERRRRHRGRKPRGPPSRARSPRRCPADTARRRGGPRAARAAARGSARGAPGARRQRSVPSERTPRHGRRCPAEGCARPEGPGTAWAGRAGKAARGASRRRPRGPERRAAAPPGLAPEVVEPHGLARLVERRRRFAPRALAARSEDLVDEARLGLELGESLADRREESLERGEQEALHLDVGYLPGAVAGLQFVDLCLVRIEGVVVDEHRIPLDSAGRVSADAIGIGVHAHDFPLYGFRVVRQEDRVVQALSHLVPAVGARKETHLGDQRFGDREDRGEQLVEATRDLARELDVGFLVAPDRNEVTLHDEDVGRLQHRVAEKAVGGLRESMIAQLILQRRDALDPRDRDEPREEKMQLPDLRYESFQEVVDLLRIDADREVVDDVVADVLLDLAQAIETGREHVVVGDEQERVVGVLQLHTVGERADIVPDVELSGRAIAREDALPRRLRGRRWLADSSGLSAHGRCDGTGSTRASSSATSVPTSSRLPTKKWSTPLTVAMRACGIAARSSAAFPNWSFSAATMNVPSGIFGNARGAKVTSFVPTPTRATASARPPRSRNASTWKAPKLYPTRPTGSPGASVRA